MAKRGSFTWMLSAIVLGATLSGCAELAGVREVASAVSAQAADAQLKVGVWALCSGSSTGAVRRKFNSDAERTEFLQWCDQLQRSR